MADCECLDDSDEPRNFDLAGIHIPHHIGAPKWRHVYPDRRKAEVRGAVLPPPHAKLKPQWRHPHGTREQIKQDLRELYNYLDLPVDIEKDWATPLNLVKPDPTAADPMYTVSAVAEILTIFPALLWGLPKPDQDIDLYVWPEDSFGRGHTIVRPHWLAEEYPTGGADVLTSSTRTIEAPHDDEITFSSICCEVNYPKKMSFAPADFGPWCPPVGHDIRVFGHLVLDMSHDFQTELHPLQWLTWRQEKAEPKLEAKYGGTIVCYRTAMFSDVSGRFPLTHETIDDQTKFGGRQPNRGEKVAASIAYEARDLAPKLSIADPTIECFLVKADSYDDQIQPPSVERVGDEFLFTATVGGWTGIEASNCNRTERENNKGGFWDGWVVFRKPPDKPHTSTSESKPRTRLLLGGAIGATALVVGGGILVGLNSGGPHAQGSPATPTSATAPPVATTPPPAVVVYPDPITAYFDQATFSTYYSEPQSDPSWTYTWSLSIPRDPECAAGFKSSAATPNKASWYHQDTDQGGPCNHTAYNEEIGHPGTITLVVQPKDGSWTCTMKLRGSAPHNTRPAHPLVGSAPKCSTS